RLVAENAMALPPIRVVSTTGRGLFTMMGASRGTTVLGKFPDYIKLADDLGAKRFNSPSGTG
ncbi:MAG: hypothetical protein KJ066_24085, partial [Acidobacteria bacterium]|nr:hypothetical protein [Acidobacteriota bacterium]